MTRLPDSAWWNAVQFNVGEGQSGGGFAMSREEMTELLRMATSMVEMIGEQFQAQREMVEFQVPAADPASHGYAGERDHRRRAGARGAGEAYLARLREQADFLHRLMYKLQAALSTVEASDYDVMRGVRTVSDPLRGEL